MHALLNLLAQQDNDYWNDVLVDEARAALDSMGLGVFEELRQSWKNLTDIQQEHLAYILEGGHSSEEDLLIDDMAKSPIKSVAFRAWESQQNKIGEDAAPNHFPAGESDE